MITTDANQTRPHFELKSGLARFSLQAIDPALDRRLAWVNSVCILFLLIGILGSKPAKMSLKALPPVEEVSAVVVEPITPPPQPSQPEQTQERNDRSDSETPQVVVVTPEAPSISFAIPTIGNLVVPNAIAKAPPIAPMKAVTPLRSEPTVLNTTGASGERPQPPYPKIALDLGQQGSVSLRMTVDDSGVIVSIEIVQSSGFPMLDRSALDFVKRHWIVPPGQGTRIYEATINYKLTATTN
jgi:periplasmic protein TonB